MGDAEVGAESMGRTGAKRVAAMGGEPMARAIAILGLLRSPEGCPWDREQSFDSIKRHTLEETYEVFDAIERRDWPALQDELGDLLLQVLFYAQIAADEGLFTIRDVAAGLVAKLIRRHPHIFGEVDAADAETVVRNWEQIKRAERNASGKADGESLLAEVPRTMPALMEAGKLGSKAAKVGFDWPEVSGLLAKLREETGELAAEIGATDAGARTRVEEEFGDLLFTAVNLGRHLHVDPESALRGANGKFRRRFAAMERAAGGFAALEEASAEELDRMWGEAKRAEGENAR